jgi:spore coat-associated protein N
MRRNLKMIAKRLSMSLLAVGAVSLMVTAGSFALFSASTTNQNNVFTAGTVALGGLTPFTCTVHAGGLAPGDTGACNVSVTYTGSLEAWLGVGVSTSGALFGGANPMVITDVKDGGTSLGSLAGTYIIGKRSTGATAAVAVEYSFPLAAGNEYQGQSGAIDLMFHAVQARNNTNGTNTAPNAWN